MTRQRAQYLRRAIPRLRKKRRRPLILIRFADGQTSGPYTWTDVSTLALPAEPLPPIGWPDHWGVPRKRSFWRSLFGR